MDLSSVERDLVLAHREEQKQIKEKLLADLSACIQQSGVNSNWSNFPGTMFYARALYAMLERTGRLK